MSYTPPNGGAAHVSWAGQPAYTPPPGNAAHATWLPPAQPPDPQAAALLRHRIAAPWARSLAGRRSVRSIAPAPREIGLTTAAAWATPRRLASADFCAWSGNRAADTPQRAPWGSGQPLATGQRVRHGAVTPADRYKVAIWHRYTHPQATQCLVVWLSATAADLIKTAPWAALGVRLQHDWHAPSAASTAANEALRGPWGKGGGWIDSGTAAPSEPGNVVQTLITPILRSYIVVNDIELKRVSNNLALTALSLQIATDVDSWAYQWSASLPAGHLDDVLPASPGDPVELEATINSHAHRLIVERISLDRAHAKPRVSIGGRGLSALLAAPYAASEARHNSAADRTAAQLCDDALLINNSPASGWLIDFALTDWLVPAGAWVTLGSPIDALSAIAAAAGGTLRPHRTDKILHIEHRYPVAPWDWPTATPAYELPVEATTKVAIEWHENPPYNAVYIAGSGPGAILGHVKRAGTAGDLVAPMATDPLITHAAAARQRGLAILAAAGSGQTLTLETPILPAIGPYPVGALVRFVDGATPRLGIVRSCRINAAMPKVRQSLELECHA